MTTVNNVNLEMVVNTIFKAVLSLGHINNKWQAEYMPSDGWVSLYSVKSGMEILFPVLITITDAGAVELRSSEGEWTFFSHLPDEGDWDDEVTEVMSSVFEHELSSFISRYWARK